MQIPDSQTNWSEQGYKTLVAGEPVRIAFVGQSNYFEQCALEEPVGALEPRYFDHRAGQDVTALRSGLVNFDPHVVVVFRPEVVPPNFFDELPALTVGFLTEPLPRSIGRSHPDLDRRLGYLREVDSGQFDRVVSFDPMFTDTVNSILPVWRSLPLPVADSLYADVGHQNVPPKVFFIGRSTKHREMWLMQSKHEFNILHVAHGLDGPELRDYYKQADVCINIHNEKYPSFENRVALSLAAGHLVISEQLSPTHGLEPDIDFVEVKIPSDLAAALFHIHRHPDLYRRVRIMGRMKAEYFRASRVYPRLVQDLLWDFAAFGSQRRPVKSLAAA